jgi:RNA polymerase sigma-70 factor (ECF subfamily)
MDTGSKAAEERVGLDPLAACLANGDPRAPRELVERHHAELYRYALAMLHNASVAEDAVQEAFERAFVALGRYPEERIRALALRAWLYRITLNAVRNLVRDRSRELPVAEMPDKRFRTVSDLGDDDREAWLDVLAALERLPDRQRVAVILRYIQDLPYLEIAHITGTPLNTVKTLTRRGVERLRILLTDPDLKGGSK